MVFGLVNFENYSFFLFRKPVSPICRFDNFMVLKLILKLISSRMSQKQIKNEKKKWRMKPANWKYSWNNFKTFRRIDR